MKIHFAAQFLIISLMLTGCASDTPATQQPYKTSTPSATLAPKPRITPTITTSQDFQIPIPTSSSDELEQLIHLLKFEDCKLPCYLGITPGQTSLNDALLQLESLGGAIIGHPDSKSKAGVKHYQYYYLIKEPFSDQDISMASSDSFEIHHEVSLTAQNDIVQSMDIGIIATGSPRSIAMYQEYWSNYSMRKIFLQTGPPDQLFVENTNPFLAENGQFLLASYEKRGMVIRINGPASENNICSENEIQSIVSYLSLFNPTSMVGRSSTGRMIMSLEDLWLPVEETLGVNTQEFYNRVVSDSSVCFRPKVTTP